MNALGIAALFVIGSIFLHNIRLYFCPTETINPIIKFNKIFQLTNNKIDVQPKYYKSLYEAYHQLQQLSITQKFVNEEFNRSKFNQKILGQSLINEQQSYLCTPNYLILLLSGITQTQSSTNQWINTFQIYKLPLLQKINEISIKGRITISKQCKQTQQNNSYHLGIITQLGPALLIINNQNQYSQLKFFNFSNRTNYYQSIDIFDFGQGYLAYWQNEQPWIVKLQQNTQLSPINPQPPITTINLLAIQNQSSQTSKSIQSINVLHIFLVHKNKCIYLTIIYHYHHLGIKFKYLVSSSFLICNYTSTLLSRSIVDADLNMGPTSTQCQQYYNQGNNTWGLSCFMYKVGTQFAKYTNLYDIFNQSVTKTNRFPQKQFELWSNTINYSSNQFDENIQQSNTSYMQNDQSLMIKTMAPIFSISYYPKQLPYWRKIIFNFKYPIISQVKILKPSLPNPIIYYTSNNHHNLYSFYLSQNNQNLLQFIIPTQFYSIPTPNFDKEQEKYMRDITWLQDENLIIIVWGGAIQLYKYQFYDLLQSQSQDISKATILSFIQIFATIYCLVRTVWNE